MDTPFAPKRRFSLGRVLTGLVLISAVTFGVAYYVPLSAAHSALAREHESLNSNQRNLGAQLKLTVEQLEETQKERDQLRAKFKKLEDDAAERERERTGLLHALTEGLEKRVARKEVKVSEEGTEVAVLVENTKLFRGHQVTVHPPGKAVLCEVAKAAKAADVSVQVIGFSASDSVANPILRRDYASTLELTAARAANAALALSSCGLESERIMSSGVGHHRKIDGAASASDGQLKIMVALRGEP